MVFLGLDSEESTLALLQREDGLVFRVGHNQYELPGLYLVRGKYLPEGDPRVGEAVEDLVEDLRLSGLKSSPGQLSNLVDLWEWRARRGSERSAVPPVG